MDVEQLVILGSGPAGLTAAIYAARASLRPLVIDGLQPGGQLTTTFEVENYPGFPEGIQGPELMDRTRKQAERFGTRFLMDEVLKVDFARRPFTVHTNAGPIATRALIVATGAQARHLGLPSEEKLWGRGISACATCDAFFFREKDVLVVGGGDTALEEASYLARTCRAVTVIHRRDQFRASVHLQNRTFGMPNVSRITDHVVVECLDPGVGRFVAARLRHVRSGEERVVKADGLFVAIGHTPSTEVFAGQLDRDEAGYLRTIDGTPRTKVPGVFAAGDVADSRYRQAVTAAGSGCAAALEVERFLAAEGG
ncbi:MAG: thioredoxin-disulfide reductase [Deltaproteobacteria bacterium]|nr:thioredoxin-disulfide reductase [Deltaproteobacteria bacterium]